MDNIQHILNRVRSPRVQITYDVETNGSKVTKEIPYIMAIFSDVKGHSNKNIPYTQKKFYQLTGQNINNLMEFLDVRIKLVVPKFGAQNDETLPLDIPIYNINNFSPDHILDNFPLLKNVKNNLTALKDLKRKLVSNNTFLQSLLVETKGDTLKKALLDDENKKDKTVNEDKKDDKKTGADSTQKKQ